MFNSTRRNAEIYKARERDFGQPSQQVHACRQQNDSLYALLALCGQGQ
jgi:hypothetical protein